MITFFHNPHIEPNIGIGLGPGIPWSVKKLNVEVAFLEHVKNIQNHFIQIWGTT